MLDRLFKKRGDRVKELTEHDKLVMLRERIRDDRITPGGGELMDDTPMEPPIGYKKQPSMADLIKSAIQSERLALEARAAGFETFEESEDFDIDDDDDPLRRSQYEHDEYAEMSLRELRAYVREKELEAAGKGKGNGNTNSDERRTGNAGDRGRDADQELQGNAGSKQNAPDRGSLQESNRDVGKAKE